MLLNKHIIATLLVSIFVISSCSLTKEQREGKNTAIDKDDKTIIDSIGCTDCYRTIILNFYNGKKWDSLKDNYSFVYYYLTLYVDSSGSLTNDRNKHILNSPFCQDYLDPEEINLLSTQLIHAPFLLLHTTDDWNNNNDGVFYLDTLFTSKKILSYITHVFIDASRYPDPSSFYTYDPTSNKNLVLEDFIKPGNLFNQYIHRTYEKNKKQIWIDYQKDSLDISDPCGALDPMMFTAPYDYSKIKLANDSVRLVCIEQKGIRVSLNTIDYIKSYTRTPCFEEESTTEHGPVYRTCTMLLPIDSIQSYLNIQSEYGLYFKHK